MQKQIRIGGASGFWGESDIAVPQFLKNGNLDYMVFDYLAEITMSVLARARAADRDKGYAVDFVSSFLGNNLSEIARQKIKVISNAGGVNPTACADAVRRLVAELGLDLKVAVVLGDDILPCFQAGEFSDVEEMFTGAELPPIEKLHSANAYLGAFPVAQALAGGADIVLTGRGVDSAVTLGACIHAFGWGPADLDELAGGALAGHVIECGPQATGGNFTDWRDAGDLANIGYPIAQVSPDGSFTCEKPEGTGGLVSFGTVAEQIVYEIGDPQTYVLPDVTCDFSHVMTTQVGPDKVRVTGAKGRAPTEHYKVSVAWHDGFKASINLVFTGFEAEAKFRAYAVAALIRARKKLSARNLPDFDDICIEPIGSEGKYGAQARDLGPREIAGRITVKHMDKKGAAIFVAETIGAGLATPAGLSAFSGGKPKPMPIVRLFSCLVPKEEVPVTVVTDGGTQQVDIAAGTPPAPPAVMPDVPVPSEPGQVIVPLIKLAFGRSGDKGDIANIGLIARDPEYLPYIAATLTAETVAARFAHQLKGRVERFYMPGIHALNFVLHDALGGGGTAALQDDPLGKAYAQILLDHPIPVPTRIAEAL